MIEHTLNQAETFHILKKESVLINNQNVIPTNRAITYLGKAAVDYASQKSGDWNIYCLGQPNLSLKYLYMKGFEKAVTFHNISILAKIGNENKEI